MGRTYWALAIVAALAIVVNTLAPSIEQGLERGFLVRYFTSGPQAIASAVYLGQLLLKATSLTAAAMTTGALTFAVVVAAQTGRKGWLAALLIVGALAVYIPAIMDYHARLFMYYQFLYLRLWNAIRRSDAARHCLRAGAGLRADGDTAGEGVAIGCERLIARYRNMTSMTAAGGR